MRRPPFAALLVVLIAAALPVSCARPGEPAGPEPSTPPVVGAPAPVPGCADPAGWSLRDKLAQLLMVGIRDADDARAVVADHHVGGIFIGSWTDLSLLTDGSLGEITRAAQPLPLAVSVDEEGGRVSRLSTLIGATPAARALTRTHTVDQVYALALDRGRQLHEHGITVDFAPVVDVTDADDDTVIGDRSFSADPQQVSAYAGAYARGLRDAGVLPVLKHFPGHGHGSGDSHTGGVRTPPLAELQNIDLVPYRALVAESPVAVMLGHLQVPGLTGDEPASLSRPAVQLLRDGVGYGAPRFDGLVFTDDLSSMAAINAHYGVAEAVLRALRAGVDVALWVTTQEVPAVLDRLEQAVAAGELTTPAIDASLARLAAVKRGGSPCGG